MSFAIEDAQLTMIYILRTMKSIDTNVFRESAQHRFDYKSLLLNISKGIFIFHYFLQSKERAKQYNELGNLIVAYRQTHFYCTIFNVLGHGGRGTPSLRHSEVSFASFNSVMECMTYLDMVINTRRDKEFQRNPCFTLNLRDTHTCSSAKFGVEKSYRCCFLQMAHTWYIHL